MCSPDGEEQVLPLTLEDILVFGTAADVEPPIGFHPRPTLVFREGSPFPSTNTCINAIYLPRQEMSFSDFSYYIGYGIANSAGFSQL
jgi:hypothetical protein